MSIIDRIRQYDEFSVIRRDLHAHPELGMEEHRTSEIVAERLREWGIEVHRNVGKTGVVGVLRSGNGRATIGLRADMDALPISEATGLDYASKHRDRMHACGHDGHTAILLCAAKYLAETRNFNGTVNLIFQPAEEGLGGAEAMLQDGIFERFPCDAIFGLHNWPGLPVGQVLTSSGARFAGGAFFDLTITGKGAHGAMPEQGIDAIAITFQIGSAFQTIVSRQVSALDTAVVSITRIHAGDAYNVSPSTVTIGGTIRALKRDTIAYLENRMRSVAEGIASGFGAQIDMAVRTIGPPTINNREEAAHFIAAATDICSEANVTAEAPPIMASEDFGTMLEQRPGAHLLIGNGPSAPVHTPGYDFNDDAIPYGAAIFAAITERKLAKSLD